MSSTLPVSTSSPLSAGSARWTSKLSDSMRRRSSGGVWGTSQYRFSRPNTDWKLALVPRSYGHGLRRGQGGKGSEGYSATLCQIFLSYW